MERVWDRFLTEQDKQHVAKRPRKPIGFGHKAAVLMVDNYRNVVGDRPEPLLEAIETWPSSTGLVGWQALEQIGTLLAESRAAQLPVIHLTGMTKEESGVAGWSESIGKGRTRERSSAAQERHARRYEIVEQAAPIDGEAVLKKVAPSAFFGTPLASHLNALGVDTLIVGGESTSGCVRASVVEAVSYRYRVIVVEECVYDRHEAAHAINLFDMHQKYADVLPLAEVIEWIRGQAGSQNTGPQTVGSVQG